MLITVTQILVRLMFLCCSELVAFLTHRWAPLSHGERGGVKGKGQSSKKFQRAKGTEQCRAHQATWMVPLGLSLRTAEKKPG